MNNRLISILIVVLAIVFAGYVIYTQIKPQTQQSDSLQQSPTTTDTTQPATPPEEVKPVSELVAPISDPSSRITKKFFGTYVTPKNSPVSPEKFTGYHTGLDFETTPAEANTDVPINVICSGKLLKKTTATGYGGYAVQSCTINNQAVTVVYGHLRLSSIGPSIGTELKAGDSLGLLGTGYSSETSGERKHLHLSIHIGSGINIKGYVQTKSELDGWMDPQTVLGL